MAATSSPPPSKTVRHNLLYLYHNQERWSELDRFMIALHRFQTEKDGRVAYRRLLGMHGGGGGTSDKDFKARMEAKMKADLKAHYNDVFPDEYFWPEPTPNAAYPALQAEADRPFTYTFCWHGKPQFIVWHRALMAEFERELQTFDPKFSQDDPGRHQGAAALGVPYWAWENWDGVTLPIQFSLPFYIVRTSVWTGYAQGHIFPNPLHRWFAPVSVKDQEQELFPPSLTDTNCTTRALPFHDPSIPHTHPWQIHTTDESYAMSFVVNHSLQESHFLRFASTEKGGDMSIENPHNKFHNHVGGDTLGGVFGPGLQPSPIPTQPDTFKGTMTLNQSIFDPIFWMHHSNVERQLCSWQRLWGAKKLPESEPPVDLMATVLYPWTKPQLVATGQLSWNTPTDPKNDATFSDWFNADLTYEYDEYLVPTQPVMALEREKFKKEAQRVQIKAKLSEKTRGGEFTLHSNAKKKASIGILSGWGTGCARCHQRTFTIRFDASHFVTGPEEAKAILSSLSLQRNGVPVDVLQWTFKILPPLGQSS